MEGGVFPDVKDPRSLLNNAEKKAKYSELQFRLRKVVSWFSDSLAECYPIPINWRLVTQGLLSHLGIIQGDLGALGIQECPPSERDLILVQRLR